MSRPAHELDLLRRSPFEPRAFHELMDLHADRLYRLAVSLVGNSADAEDAVQETFAAAFAGARKFRGESSVGTWLTRILVTQAAVVRRGRKRRRIEPVDVSEMTVEASGDAAAGVEAKLDLHAALEQLSAEHRQVLVLREFGQMSYEEMAQALDVPRGTIESRLFRARAELRVRLEAYASEKRS